MLLLAGALAAAGLTIGLTSAAPPGARSKSPDVPLEIASVHRECNATANELGVHVSLDGEDWQKLQIINPNGKVIFAVKGPGNAETISWTAVSAPPPGFPDEPIDVVSYQVLVPETLDVIVPANVLSLTLPPEYSAALGPGDHPFEVLAIDANHNQTTSEGTFTLP
ncbi:MAG TPA: hypothetical protein VFY71_03680 [Planctomycetota bacterium]|nr:hypothetical protein [Planctomycetota bacterium]